MSCWKQRQWGGDGNNDPSHFESYLMSLRAFSSMAFNLHFCYFSIVLLCVYLCTHTAV